MQIPRELVTTVLSCWVVPRSQTMPSLRLQSSSPIGMCTRPLEQGLPAGGAITGSVCCPGTCWIGHGPGRGLWSGGEHTKPNGARSTSKVFLIGGEKWPSHAISFSSVQFSRSVMSNSLQPHGWQHASLPCPSPTPRAYSNSCPLS